MHPARLAAMVLMALFVGTACGTSTIDSTGVTAEQLRTHTESRLTYPNAHNVFHSETDELDRGSFVPLSPTPAYADITFDTTDRPNLIIAWYDAWLKQRGWEDVVIQGDGSRSWVRGVHEDFVVDCSYQSDSSNRVCHADYTLRSARFKSPNAVAPPLDDPVSLSAVEARRVGLRATVDLAQYVSGDPIPRDGTPEASVARSDWPTKVCCAVPVVLLDTAAAEQASPLRSAYHAATIEVAEYDRPDVKGRGFGFIERSENANLTSSGFVLAKTGGTKIGGQDASAYAYVRGDREIVLFAIAYGPSQEAAQNIKFRDATLSIIYDVAPNSCPLSNAECFNDLFGMDGTRWSAAAA
jgi:hypothetical protein